MKENSMAIREFPNETTDLTPGETLDELNFRYAQAMLPFAVMLGMFCFQGIVGNVLVISVFFKSFEYNNTNFKIFVIFLATMDLVSCVSLLPMEIDKTRNFFIYSNSTCKIKCFFHIFCNTVVIFTFFLICIDQYRKVCRPLGNQILPHQAVKLLILVVFMAVLLSLMASIMCGVSSFLKPNSNNEIITVYICSAEKQYRHSTIRYIYKVGMTGILVLISVAILVMYVFIMTNIIKHNKQQTEIVTTEIESLEMIMISNKQVGYTGRFNKDSIQRNEVMTSSQNEANVTVLQIYDQREDGPSGTQVTRKASNSLRRSVSSKGLPNMTLIWFTLTVIFIVTFIIHAGLSFLTTSEHQMSPTTLLLYQLFFRLYYINHIINPLVYALLDKRFRKLVYKLLNYVRRNQSIRVVTDL